jgi:hypothetical protein
MPVRLGCTVVIEDAVDRIVTGIKRQIVQSDITVNKHAIFRADRHTLVALDDLLHDADKTVVIHHVGKPTARSRRVRH